MSGCRRRRLDEGGEGRGVVLSGWVRSGGLYPPKMGMACPKRFSVASLSSRAGAAGPAAFENQYVHLTMPPVGLGALGCLSTEMRRCPTVGCVRERESEGVRERWRDGERASEQARAELAGEDGGGACHCQPSRKSMGIHCTGVDEARSPGCDKYQDKERARQESGRRGRTGDPPLYLGF